VEVSIAMFHLLSFSCRLKANPNYVFFFLQDVLTSCCDWLSEFLEADTLVVRAIKDVVSAGHDSRIKDALDVERYMYSVQCMIQK